MIPFCFVLRTMITRSALVVLRDFTSAERRKAVAGIFRNHTPIPAK